MLDLTRRAYFPRTPPLSFARSYSGRRSSSNSVLFSFFIVSSFVRRRFSGADNPDVSPALGVRHYQEASVTGHTRGDEATFTCRMVRIIIRQGEWIIKSRAGLVERHPMFADV